MPSDNSHPTAVPPEPLRHAASLGRFGPRVRKRLAAMREERFAQRFWGKDPTLWKQNEEAGWTIRNRLGWLDLPESMEPDCGWLLALAAEVRQSGFTHALLLGMGGSSLCADVCRRSFPRPAGFLKLSVLDSTDPAAVRRAGEQAPLEKTLFLVSTKSGTTTETLCFYRYFYEEVRKRKGDRAGENFLAITDPGSPLVAMAAEKGFRRTFLNPPDVGGRFSALSYFGLVPAALLGVDIRRLLARAARFLPRNGSEVATEANPAIELGAILGEMAQAGRDKVTFLISPPIAALGCWVEQLVAESTGKEGKGLLPIDGELPGPARSYKPDRLFVHLHLASSADNEIARSLKGIEKAGHPVIRIALEDRLDLGTEFFRWEIATAVAGSILKINPFDEPNVQESKNNTKRLLGKFQSEGKLEVPEPVARESRICLYGNVATRPGTTGRSARSKQNRKIPGLLREFFQNAKKAEYVALLAYLAPSPAREKWLRRIRARLREALGVAATAGFGPRYLHSTGQFHKGGPPGGWFLEITAEDKADLAIPGSPFGFGLLKQAQALGDLEALEARKRPVARLHLEGTPEAGQLRLAQWIEEALKGRRT